MEISGAAIEVRCTPAGIPVRLVHQGAVRHLAAAPVRWFERRKWWEESARVPIGAGAGAADCEIWRLQLRPTGGHGAPETVDVGFDPQDNVWRLVKVHSTAMAA